MIRASCYHEVASSDELFDVRFRSWDCDAIEGYLPCVTYASYCIDCAARLELEGELITSDAEEDKWLHQ